MATAKSPLSIDRRRLLTAAAAAKEAAEAVCAKGWSRLAIRISWL
jgi:hypothetical protein